MLIGEELRWAVNTDAPSSSSLYSSYVTPVSEGSVIRFENGHGHGHGVGMCQWCAEAQAKRGIGHEQIVLSAYRGAILRKAY
jgi:SpoIID/LytB domain protein